MFYDINSSSTAIMLWFQEMQVVVNDSNTMPDVAFLSHNVILYILCMWWTLTVGLSWWLLSV